MLTPAQVREIAVTIAREASTHVELPVPTPEISPNPTDNEWDMLFVGLPIWLTADQAPTIDASTTQQGIPLQLVARRGTTVFDMGDGTRITCRSMTPRPKNADAKATSPDCGHVYTKRGDYTITATTTWTLDWAALGNSGSIPMTRTATTALTIGELKSVVVR